MPLLANGKQSTYAPQKPAEKQNSTVSKNGTTQAAATMPTTEPSSLIDLKYVGTDGTAPAKTDTYSVLASFGAKGSAQKTGDASVGIAQYFATGLAARTLAYAGGALINTGDKAAESAKDTSQAAAAAATKSVSVGSTADTRLSSLAFLASVYNFLKTDLAADSEAQAQVTKLDKIDRSAEAPGFPLYYQPGANGYVMATRAYPLLAKGHTFTDLVQYYANLNDSVSRLKTHLDPYDSNLQIPDPSDTSKSTPATAAFVAQAMADYAKEKEQLSTLDKKVGQDPTVVAAVQYYSQHLFASTTPSK